jgi:hypothetical protein
MLVFALVLLTLMRRALINLLELSSKRLRRFPRHPSISDSLVLPPNSALKPSE